MPLDSVKKHGALQCKATAKHSGRQCRNPAAFGMRVCRMHGARRKETILREEAHPNYKHGNETLVAKAERSAGAAELRRLEGLMHVLNMAPPTTKKTSGRKPRAKTTSLAQAVLEHARKMDMPKG